jgi:hypothetical protein
MVQWQRQEMHGGTAYVLIHSGTLVSYQMHHSQGFSPLQIEDLALHMALKGSMKCGITQYNFSPTTKIWKGSWQRKHSLRILIGEHLHKFSKFGGCSEKTSTDAFIRTSYVPARYSKFFYLDIKNITL